MGFVGGIEEIEICVGDIMVVEGGKYMIVRDYNGYKWVNLSTGYMSFTNYKSISEVMEHFKDARVFKNDKFTLILK